MVRKGNGNGKNNSKAKAKDKAKARTMAWQEISTHPLRYDCKGRGTRAFGGGLGENNGNGKGNSNGSGNSNFKDNVKGSGQECPLYTIFTYFASVTCSRDSL